MILPPPPLPDDEFLEVFKDALLADEADEVVLGWLAEGAAVGECDGLD